MPSTVHLSIIVDDSPPSTPGVSVRHSLRHSILILDDLLGGLKRFPPARTISRVPPSGGRVGTALLRRLSIGLLRRARLARLTWDRLARFLLNHNPPRRAIIKLLDHISLSLDRASFRGFTLRILRLHRLAIAVDMDNLPNHSATIFHNNLRPVAVPDVLAGDVARLTHGWRTALRRRRAAFWWWHSRVNGPDDLAALVLVDDFHDIPVQVLVSDLALDAKLLGRLGLACFVGDFVGDGPRALADDFLWFVIGLCGDLDDGSLLLVRLFYWRALTEGDVRHVGRDFAMAGSGQWLGGRNNRGSSGTTLRLLKGISGPSSTLSLGVLHHKRSTSDTQGTSTVRLPIWV